MILGPRAIRVSGRDVDNTGRQRGHGVVRNHGTRDPVSLPFPGQPSVVRPRQEEGARRSTFYDPARRLGARRRTRREGFEDCVEVFLGRGRFRPPDAGPFNTDERVQPLTIGVRSPISEHVVRQSEHAPADTARGCAGEHDRFAG